MPQSSIKPVTYDTNVLRTPQGEPWKAMIFGEVVKEVVGAATVPRRSTRRIADDADPLLRAVRLDGQEIAGLLAGGQPVDHHATGSRPATAARSSSRGCHTDPRVF